MNLGNIPVSIGSSCAGLCRRGRPGRFRCGDQGAMNMACKASGTHRAGSWRRRTARLLMTLSDVRVKHSSLSVSRQALAPGRRARTCSPNGGISFLYICPRIFSYDVMRVSAHVVSRETARSVSVGPRQYWRIWLHVERRDFVFYDCQVCASKTAYCGDGLLRGVIALMALCR